MYAVGERLPYLSPCTDANDFCMRSGTNINNMPDSNHLDVAIDCDKTQDTQTPHRSYNPEFFDVRDDHQPRRCHNEKVHHVPRIAQIRLASQITVSAGVKS